MMIEKYFILAMFIQAIFPVFILLKMLPMRLKALKRGDISAKYFKSYQSPDKEVPKELVIISRHYGNLFEMPMLFLILGTLLISLQLVSVSFLIAAWIYVFLRLIHTFIHLGSNRIMQRLTIFGLSCFVLLGMWIAFIGKIFLV